MKILIYAGPGADPRPLRKVFEVSGLWVESCRDAEHFISLSMTELYAAVVVMGVAATEELVQLYSRWKIQGCRSLFVALSDRQSGVERARALEAGIDRYLISPFSYSRLVTDISLNQFKAEMPERTSFKTVSFELDVLGRMAFCHGVLLVLTKIEFEILALLIRRRGIVLSRVQIWEEVWGYQEYSLANTIDVHINRLRRKLPAEARGLIRTVYGIGYRMHESA